MNNIGLKDYLERKASEWVGYNRPAVDWMITERGNRNTRLVRTMHDFPLFGEVVKQIPRPLTRQGVYDCYKEDLYKGFIATLLWNNMRQEPFHIYLYLPFLVEPIEDVRERLTKAQEHLKQGDMSLAELFNAMNDPEQLQIATRINQTRFSLALDFLSSSDKIAHPLLFNQWMMSVHCALLLEEKGLSQPFYDFEERIVAGKNSSLAECYEDYCRRFGDITLWAGSGNPEFLMDWINYSEDGYLAYLLARDIIAQFRIKKGVLKLKETSNQ